VVATLLGTVPLRSLQGGIEATRGVTGAATRVLPFLTCDINPLNEFNQRIEVRGSLIEQYRKPLLVKHSVGISGFEVVPSYEYFAYYAAGALKGLLVASSTVNVAVKRFNYLPLSTSDDLVTYTFEALTDVTSGDFDIPFSVINRMTWGWDEGGPFMLSMDILGQQLTAQTPTGSLAEVTNEEIDPSTALAYIDDGGGIIGTTAITNLQSVRYTVENHFLPLFGPDGNVYPSNWYRSAPRSMRCEATFDFTTNTEAAAFAARTERMIRTKVTGTTIASSSPSLPKSLTTNAYLYWTEGPFTTNEGKIQVRMAGNTVLDTAAATDWSVQLDTDIGTSLSTI
jgi:hypothetical protein